MKIIFLLILAVAGNPGLVRGASMTQPAFESVAPVTILDPLITVFSWDLGAIRRSAPLHRPNRSLWPSGGDGGHPLLDWSWSDRHIPRGFKLTEDHFEVRGPNGALIFPKTIRHGAPALIISRSGGDDFTAEEFLINNAAIAKRANDLMQSNRTIDAALEIARGYQGEQSDPFAGSVSPNVDPALKGEDLSRAIAVNFVARALVDGNRFDLTRIPGDAISPGALMMRAEREFGSAHNDLARFLQQAGEGLVVSAKRWYFPRLGTIGEDWTAAYAVEWRDGTNSGMALFDSKGRFISDLLTDGENRPFVSYKGTFRGGIRIP